MLNEELQFHNPALFKFINLHAMSAMAFLKFVNEHDNLNFESELEVIYFLTEISKRSCKIKNTLKGCFLKQRTHKENEIRRLSFI